MRLVRQLGNDGDWGCGIACLAMVLGKTYKAVKREYENWEKDGTTHGQMKRALVSNGFNVVGPISIGQNDLRDFSYDLLLYGICDGDEHWAVWDASRGRLLDPFRYKNGSTARFRCTSYMVLRG
jgi:hypothetical protein